MQLTDWMNEKIRKMEWTDMSLIKLSSAAFALLIAKLWTPLLSLDWYWYLAVAVLAAIKPCYKLLKKESSAI